KLKLLVVIRLK
nr:Chain B, 11-mer synthetic peptide [synthetic construct]